MVELITEKREWNSILANLDQYDFYHTYDYHHISKSVGEEPILIRYFDGNKSIAIPLLVRSIKNTPYKDATSVYGYAGPLTQNIGPDFDNDEFKNQLYNTLREKNIISVFSRLHPYISTQTLVLENIGEISSMGHIVNIDLTKDLDSQRQEYQKRLKTYINKSKRTFTVTKAETECDVLKYIEIYYENMRRVDADESYFFKPDYFFALLESNEFEAEILLATCNNTHEIVGGAMFVKKNNFVQYHLAGAKNQWLHLNPIKLLIDAARIKATKKKYQYFNLGGGKGGQEDSLFQFKIGFSKDLRLFNIWKYVVNQEIYDNLVNEVIKDATPDKSEAKRS